MPDHLKNCTPHEKLQFTLVDCPGHASLIRTIIGGAQIIDLMILVVDVTKGMQTQTAECLIIGEITCQKMIVVLNKIDLLPEGNRKALIDKMTKKMKLTLAKSVFENAPIVSVAAKPGGPDASEISSPEGLPNLIEIISKYAFIPERHITRPFLFAVDHCFSIRGQGTVMTGTVLQGTVCVNDTVEIPSMHITKKVKSMQMFKKPVEQAAQGDRIGLCVTQFDPKQLERGIACAPGYVSTLSAAIVSVHKIKYFKGNVNTKAKFHISMGHETVMAKITFFGMTENCDEKEIVFNYDREYKYHTELLPSLANDKENGTSFNQYVLLEFEKPVLAIPGCLVIGSKLDMDIHVNSCRLAFWGHLLEGIEDKNFTSSILPKIKVYKEKSKRGIVERASNEYEIIGKGMFKKETNIQLFVGLQIHLSTGEVGTIESSFGQSGKMKIHIPGGLKESTFAQLSSTNKKKKGKQTEDSSPLSNCEPVQIILNFKRYVFDPHKKMIQI
ncbi:hypothetical protein L9F63_012619 [Diploptera punctata]|uniref:Tr-type G domain-containing protein n=1 Tax=Diploptera punctata TaxID=6984 RepID=A0AAD8ACB1_DIPPU|nr:hypothetical protein L9F63_012619 [Diploptera punctata]